MRIPVMGRLEHEQFLLSFSFILDDEEARDIAVT